MRNYQFLLRDDGEGEHRNIVISSRGESEEAVKARLEEVLNWIISSESVAIISAGSMQIK